MKNRAQLPSPFSSVPSLVLSLPSLLSSYLPLLYHPIPSPFLPRSGLLKSSSTEGFGGAEKASFCASNFSPKYALFNSTLSEKGGSTQTKHLLNPPVVRRINKNNQLAQVKLDETKQFRRNFVSILFQFFISGSLFFTCDPFIFDKPVKMLMSLKQQLRNSLRLVCQFQFRYPDQPSLVITSFWSSEY